MKLFNADRKKCGAKLPVISICMAALSLLLYLWGNDAGPFLQYDRALIASGEVWRIITGHWIHWSFDHFLWCTVTFIVLGSICEQLNKRGFLISLAASAIIIPVVSWFVDPSMLLYRGLSGICSSIFIVGAALMVQQALSDRDWVRIILPALGGLLFIGKIVFEFVRGQALFVHGSMFSPVPLAHLVGGIIGLITVAFLLVSQRRPIP